MWVGYAKDGMQAGVCPHSTVRTVRPPCAWPFRRLLRCTCRQAAMHRAFPAPQGAPQAASAAMPVHAPCIMYTSSACLAALGPPVSPLSPPPPRRAQRVSAGVATLTHLDDRVQHLAATCILLRRLPQAGQQCVVGLDVLRVRPRRRELRLWRRLWRRRHDDGRCSCRARRWLLPTHVGGHGRTDFGASGRGGAIRLRRLGRHPTLRQPPERLCARSGADAAWSRAHPKQAAGSVARGACAAADIRAAVWCETGPRERTCCRRRHPSAAAACEQRARGRLHVAALEAVSSMPGLHGRSGAHRQARCGRSGGEQGLHGMLLRPCLEPLNAAPQVRRRAGSPAAADCDAAAATSSHVACPGLPTARGPDPDARLQPTTDEACELLLKPAAVHHQRGARQQSAAAQPCLPA